VNQNEIPDASYYGIAGLSVPTFRPWLMPGEFGDAFNSIGASTLVGTERLYTLWCLAKNVASLQGEIWECGVYKGGSAKIISQAVPGKRMRLFDTFDGIPNADESVDHHKTGDFRDTSAESVGELIDGEKVSVHVGVIPETFKGLEECRLAMAHVDVDTYQSVKDCCEFIWPRVSLGGVMVFDDYGFRSCPGARAAVDEYFKERKAMPLVLNTGHAIVIKSVK
jgi:O-methyltransferase